MADPYEGLPRDLGSSMTFVSARVDSHEVPTEHPCLWPSCYPSSKPAVRATSNS